MSVYNWLIENYSSSSLPKVSLEYFSILILARDMNCFFFFLLLGFGAVAFKTTCKCVSVVAVWLSVQETNKFQGCWSSICCSIERKRWSIPEEEAAEDETIYGIMYGHGNWLGQSLGYCVITRRGSSSTSSEIFPIKWRFFVYCSNRESRRRCRWFLSSSGYDYEFNKQQFAYNNLLILLKMSWNLQQIVETKSLPDCQSHFRRICFPWPDKGGDFHKFNCVSFHLKRW